MQIKSTILDDLSSNLSNSKIDMRNVYIEALYDTMNYTTELEAMFESISGPQVYNFLNEAELKMINKIILHKKDRSFNKKLQKLDGIIKPKGFKRSGCGTNRVVYEPLDPNARFCLKIALDRAGKSNNPDEIVNQKYLKPFVAKCFDVSDDGNVGVFERVIPIENLNQFWSVRDDIFSIIEKLIGRFIIDDFGTRAFKNWGIRPGFGPVLLDYADMYILDPKILVCNRPRNFNPNDICDGEIDYNEGFNNLICTKCGSLHNASEFKHGRQKLSVVASKGRRIDDMAWSCTIYKNGEVIATTEKAKFNDVVEQEQKVLVPPTEENKKSLENIDDLKKQLKIDEEINKELYEEVFKPTSKQKRLVKEKYVVGKIEPEEPKDVELDDSDNTTIEEELTMSKVFTDKEVNYIKDELVKVKDMYDEINNSEDAFNLAETKEDREKFNKLFVTKEYDGKSVKLEKLLPKWAVYNLEDIDYTVKVNVNDFIDEFKDELLELSNSVDNHYINLTEDVYEEEQYEENHRGIKSKFDFSNAY